MRACEGRPSRGAPQGYSSSSAMTRAPGRAKGLQMCTFKGTVVPVILVTTPPRRTRPQRRGISRSALIALTSVGLAVVVLLALLFSSPTFLIRGAATVCILAAELNPLGYPTFIWYLRLFTKQSNLFFVFIFLN